MQFQYLFRITLTSLVLSTKGYDDFYNFSNKMQEQFSNILKKFPLVGCTLECFVDAGDMEFLWYSNAQVENLVNFSNPSLIRKDATTVFIIPGYFGGADRPWIQDLRRILVNEHDVVVVDWSSWSRLDYYTSSSATKWIGFIVGELLANLHSNYQVPLDKIILIGFSLGAHISGFAGNKFEQLTGEKLPVIIGLDPAGPMFRQKPETERLSPGDALQVKVLHCNAFEFGISIPCGTLDVWVNDGCLQPRCSEVFRTNPLNVPATIACSHLECYRVFMQALLHPQNLIAEETKPWRGCNVCESTGYGRIDVGDLRALQTGHYCLRTVDQSQGSSSNLSTSISSYIYRSIFVK